MKAIMSERVKNWLKDNKTRIQLIKALDLLHANNCEPTEVEIDGKKYILRLATPKY